MIRLRVEKSDGDVHRTFRGTTVVIGRSGKCDVSLPSAKGLSRFHCRLTLRDGACIIEDLGSRNRSLVNGRPVERGPVAEGDLLTLGTARIWIESLRDEEPTEELVHPCLHCGHLFSARGDKCPRCGTAIRKKGRSRAIGEHTFTGYRLIRRIGSGGMGVVFEAREIESDRGVALKVLRPHLARDASYIVRFIEEMRLLTSLRHPGIVEVYGRGREEDLHFLTMELVKGRSARDAMRDRGRHEWSSAVEIVWQAANALHAAHRQAGIVHGDVKPSNFLLTPAGQVKLCDFGLARVDLKRPVPSRSAAVEAERRGTAAYSPPERFKEGGTPTVQGDIYALGVSLFQMVTGSLPFRGLEVATLREAHRRLPVPAIVEACPDANPGLQLLVEHMMAKDPDARFPDYLALLEDLALLRAA